MPTSEYMNRTKEEAQFDKDEAKEEHHFIPADRVLSFAIFVTLFLLSALACFLKAPFSEQARMYAYHIVSYTLSIFCAVTLQHVCFKRFLDVLRVEESPGGWSILYRLTRALVWHCIFLLSQRLIRCWTRRQKNKLDLDVVNVWLKASLFLAHVCSFAWIGLWGEVSYAAMKLAYPIQVESIVAVLIVLAVFLYASLMLIVLRCLRWTWMLALESGDMQGEGVTEHRRSQDTEVKQMSVEVNVEGNMEAISLAGSFIVCQGLRFLTVMLFNSNEKKGNWEFLARIYNEEGEEGPLEFEHNGREVAFLYGLAVMFWASSVIFTWVRNQWRDPGCHHVAADGDEPDFWHLVDKFLSIFLGMVGMWCFYYAANWSMALTIEHHSFLQEDFRLDKSLALRWFLNAAIVTVVSLIAAMCAIRLSTWAQHLKSNLRQLAVVVPECTFVVGAAVGISWEKAFNSSSLALLSTTEHKAVWEVLFGMVVLLVILTIWIFFILPMSEERGYMYGFVPRLALMKGRKRTSDLQPSNARVLEHLESIRVELSQFEDAADGHYHAMD